MLIRDVKQYLEHIAPPSLQESYDNSGLIVGEPHRKVKGVLICLDVIEDVVDEAIEKKCNLIICHHPIIFKGLKSLTGANYVERTVLKAIRNNIAIYAVHTNLDNIFANGVNSMIAEKLDLEDTQILMPKTGLERAVIYAPITLGDRLKKSLINLGKSLPGASGYDFSGLGISKHGPRAKLDFQYAVPFRNHVLALIEGFGEEISYDLIPLSNKNASVGSGLIGYLKEPMTEKSFLKLIKRKMGASVIRHTRLKSRRIRKVAVCGGSGSFLLSQAKSQSADLFLTADFKYHEFFDSEGQIVIADIGHYETEQFTIELLQRIISEKFSTFAAYCTEVNTNPVYYF